MLGNNLLPHNERKSLIANKNLIPIVNLYLFNALAPIPGAVGRAKIFYEILAALAGDNGMLARDFH
jgi:hypothetical protein